MRPKTPPGSDHALDEQLALCLAEARVGPALTAEPDPARVDRWRRAFAGCDWYALIRAAGDRMITPSLHDGLQRYRQAAGMPPEVLQAIDEVRTVNAQRNTRVLAAYEELQSILAEQGIPVRPLKGMAMLLEERYPDSGERLLADIDVLVDADSLVAAMEALRRAGYRQWVNAYEPERAGREPDMAPIEPDDFRNRPDWGFYHAPAVASPRHHLSVELHTATAPPGTPLNDALARLAVRAEPSGNPAHPLPVEFHVLHGFQHSQLKDRLLLRGTIDWRHLLDLRHIISDAGDDIDWPGIRAAVTGAGVERAFALWCWQAVHYAGATSVVGMPAAGPAADRFTALRTSAWRRSLARYRFAWQRYSAGLPTRRVLTRHYGTLPRHRAVWRFARFQFARWRAHRR